MKLIPGHRRRGAADRRGLPLRVQPERRPGHHDGLARNRWRGAGQMRAAQRKEGEGLLARATRFLDAHRESERTVNVMGQVAGQAEPVSQSPREEVVDLLVAAGGLEPPTRGL